MALLLHESSAKVVGLHPEDMGISPLVFQTMVKDGRARPGAQRGLVLPLAGRNWATELSPYIVSADDANNIAVVFQSVSLQ